MGDIQEEKGKTTVQELQADVTKLMWPRMLKYKVSSLFWNDKTCTQMGHIPICAYAMFIVTVHPLFPSFCKLAFILAEFFKHAKEALGEIHIVIGNAGILNEFNPVACIQVNLVRYSVS